MSKTDKYFQLIVKSSALLVLIILIHDEYAVITNLISSSGCSEYYNGYGTAASGCNRFVNKLTFTGKYLQTYLVTTEAWLDLLVVVVFIAALLIMKPYKNEQERTPDYILQFNNFKETPNEEELWAAISKVLRLKKAQKQTSKNGIVKMIPFQQKKWRKVTNSALVVFETTEST